MSQLTRPFRPPSSQRAIKRATVAATIVALVSVTSNPVGAATKLWLAETGNWNTPGNWLPTGVPQAGDIVDITDVGASVSSTITYDYPGPAITLGSITIDLTGVGSVTDTLSIPANALTTSGDEIVGYNGSGTITQSGGTNTPLNLDLGYGNGSSGTYTLSGTGSLTPGGDEIVGVSGTGNFNQSGGTNTITAGELLLGQNSGSTGNYTLSGGSLTASGNEIVGNSGTGNFNQSGGTNTITNVGSLFVGESSGSIGTYSLSSGSLAVVGGEIVGDMGTGNFNQSGGTNTAARLDVGENNGAVGTYTLSGTGSLAPSDSEIVGDMGTGNLNQDGGTNTIAAGFELHLGEKNGSTGNYALTGGTLTANGNEIVGNSGAGNFNQTGGMNTLASGYNLHLGENSGSVGTYTLGAGSLTANGNETIGNSGTGNFKQTGGTNTIAKGYSLFLGENSGSTGTYTLSGTGALSLPDGREIVGDMGTGNFNQSGGTNTAVNLHLGENTGSSGTYSLNGTGSLVVRGDGHNEHVGVLGTGNFNQSGGTNTTNYLYLGENSGSTGGYTLIGGSLAVDFYEDVGLSGTGNFNQSGGTNTFAYLNLGVVSGSTGNYTLSGGSLTANGSEVVGESGTGNFNQTGGTNTIASGNSLYVSEDGPNGGGTYTLSGGSASVSGDTVISFPGNNGQVTLTVSGTGVMTIGGSLTIYPAPGTVVNLSGGTINTARLVTNGTPTLLNWTSGTLNLTQSVTWDSAAASTTTSRAFGASETLGANQTLMITGNEGLGGAGPFRLTLNSGSTHYVTGGITLNATGTITLNPGSTLYAATFTQAGGTVNGTLQNQGNFIYQSGQFNGRLLNQGTVSLGPSFTSGNGVENDTSMTLAASQTLTVNGAGLDNVVEFNLSGGVINGSGPLLNDVGATFSGYGMLHTGGLVNMGTLNIGEGNLDVFGSVTNNGTIDIQGGRTLFFFGNVKGAGSFTDAGTTVFLAAVSPGNSSASVGFGGNVNLASTSTLNMELGGPTPGTQYDQLLVTGQLSLGGTLQVSLINGFTPAAGSSFNILDWGTLSGTFSSLTLPAINTGLMWDTSQLYTAGVLSVISTGLSGDYNHNGVVDAADYVVWRNGLGTTYTQNDYNVWRTHFGQTAGSGSRATSAAVPEPTTLLPLIFAAAGWCFRRGRDYHQLVHEQD